MLSSQTNYLKWNLRQCEDKGNKLSPYIRLISIQPLLNRRKMTILVVYIHLVHITTEPLGIRKHQTNTACQRIDIRERANLDLPFILHPSLAVALKARLILAPTSPAKPAMRLCCAFVHVIQRLPPLISMRSEVGDLRAAPPEVTLVCRYIG